MKSVLSRLRSIGYSVRLEGGRVICSWKGAGRPDPQEARLLLDELKARKEEAVHMLAQEQKPIWSCYTCGRKEWWLRRDGAWICGVCHPNPKDLRRKVTHEIVKR